MARGRLDMSPVEKAALVDTIQKLLVEEAVAADHELQLRRKLLARRDPESSDHPMLALPNTSTNPNTNPKPGGTR